MATDDKSKNIIKSRSMPEGTKIQESQIMIGSRTEVTSTTSAERPSAPRPTKQVNLS